MQFVDADSISTRALSHVFWTEEYQRRNNEYIRLEKKLCAAIRKLEKYQETMLLNPEEHDDWCKLANFAEYHVDPIKNEFCEKFSSALNSERETISSSQILENITKDIPLVGSPNCGHLCWSTCINEFSISRKSLSLDIDLDTSQERILKELHFIIEKALSMIKINNSNYSDSDGNNPGHRESLQKHALLLSTYNSFNKSGNSDKPRAIGLWLWDYLKENHKNANGAPRGAKIAAINAFKTQFPKNIIDKLSCPSTDTRVFLNWLKFTCDCIISGKVLPFSNSKKTGLEPTIKSDTEA